MNLMLINTTSLDVGVVIYAQNNIEQNNVLDESRKSGNGNLKPTFMNGYELIKPNKENYYRHSESLLPAIEEVLVKSSTSLFDLSAIAVITGPGSFSGIRVGLATIKAFSAVNNLNVLSANMFEALSEYIKNGIMLIESTSSSFYYGIIADDAVESFGVINLDDISDFLKLQNKTVYCFESELSVLEHSYSNIETINNLDNVLFKYFSRQYENKNFKSAKDLEPFYIQISQAERQLNKLNNLKTTNIKKEG